MVPPKAIRTSIPAMQRITTPQRLSQDPEMHAPGSERVERWRQRRTHRCHRTCPWRQLDLPFNRPSGQLGLPKSHSAHHVWSKSRGGEEVMGRGHFLGKQLPSFVGLLSSTGSQTPSCLSAGRAAVEG